MSTLCILHSSENKEILMPPKQAFTPHGVLDRQGVNICLHLGHDGDGHRHLDQDPNQTNCRMGGVEWLSGCAKLNVRLSPVGHPAVPIVRPGPEFDWCSFAVCPCISRTLISEDVADRFNLGAGVNEVVRCSLPVLDMLGWQPQQPLVSVRTAKAWVDVKCLPFVEPRPIVSYQHEFEILIVQRGRVSPDLAILGRDVLQHVLLLYQGQTPAHVADDPPGPGWMYYGKNDRREV
jgi:hypothetical protein